MRKIENRKLRIEDICITVIERLIRQGYLEWKRKPDGKTEEEMEAKLDKHVILEKDVKEIGNSGIRRAAVGKKALLQIWQKNMQIKKNCHIQRRR
ncbi:MAG: hypothetical protein ACLVLH_23955 [Eisenbergiella massiliensis]